MAVASANVEERRSGARQLTPSVTPPPRSALARCSEADRELLAKLFSDKAEYMDNELFGTASAEKELFGQTAKLLRAQAVDFQPMPPIGARDRVHAGMPTLSAEQEKTLFQRFNYSRFRVLTSLEAHTGKRMPMREVRHLLAWAHRCLQCRADIVRANIPLVLAMAKRTRLAGVDFSELISEGNMALLRSVDKFDCARGFKFSTYACRAILKSFSRVAMRASRYRGRFPTEFDPTLERSDFVDRKREGHENDCVDEVRHIIVANRADLNAIEMTVIRERFALTHPASSGQDPKTLEQVGAIIGVTKERVRQIQNKALGKIRDVLEEEFLAA